MDLTIGIDALRLINRPRGASLYDISNELGITVRYAREVVDNLSTLFSIYDGIGGDPCYPRRKIFYLDDSDRFGRKILECRKDATAANKKAIA